MFRIRRHLRQRKIASQQAKNYTEQLLGHTFTKAGKPISNREKTRMTKIRFRQLMQDYKNSQQP